MKQLAGIRNLSQEVMCVVFLSKIQISSSLWFDRNTSSRCSELCTSAAQLLSIVKTSGGLVWNCYCGAESVSVNEWYKRDVNYLNSQQSILCSRPLPLSDFWHWCFSSLKDLIKLMDNIYIAADPKLKPVKLIFFLAPFGLFFWLSFWNVMKRNHTPHIEGHKEK